MPTYRDEAVVLRTQKLGEADRIITMLTRRLGKVRAVAKGVRKTSSRFGARLEPAMVIDVQCYEGRSLDNVTQVMGLEQYGGQLARNYETWTAASAMLETCDRLTEEKEPALQQYLLLRGALASLAGGAHDQGLVLDAYLLRTLAIAGYAPVSPTARNAVRRARIGRSTSWPVASSVLYAVRPARPHRRRRH